MPPIAFVVDRRENGQTLASVLKKRYGISWSHAKRLVERGHVKVSGQVETEVARRLKLGKRIELATGSVETPKSADQDAPKTKAPTPRAPTPKPGKARAGSPGGKGSTPRGDVSKPMQRGVVVPGIDVTYVDDAVVVVHKPAGLTTMRHKEEAEEFGGWARKYLPKTLAELLPGLLGTPGRPLIAVHRIDRDTSGLVVFARTHAAAEHLMKQFRKHSVDRRYLALTRGVPPSGRIESVLVRDRGDGRRGSTTVADAPDGKRSVTHVRVIEELPGFAVVECRLETGRTHQVRIHLGEGGTPLCGETTYDRPVNGKPVPDKSGAERPMLHAARLGFTHPESGEVMKWEVPPPADFVRVREKLRGG